MVRGPVLFEHVSNQLSRLCEVTGIDAARAAEPLSDLLKYSGASPRDKPPTWHSDVSDDHTPVEFSVAFTHGEPPALRVLGEALAPRPDPAANLAAARRFLRVQANAFGLSMARFDRVWEIFDVATPQGTFGLWHSMIFRSGRPAEFKVYVNPELRGPALAPELVAEAMGKLGLATPYQTVLDRAVRPGELGRKDRLTFFALDLRDGPRARVKVYLTHHEAETGDVVRAASAVDGAAAAEGAEFCDLTGATRCFDRRPLVSGYTFFEGTASPVGYSLYVPIRSYVSDDQEARDRVAAVLDRHGFDPTQLDRAIRAVTQRPLDEGVGLIAHVSLRLGAPRPGVSVYLSSEAYQVAPPLIPLTASTTGRER
jgi:DMATS type aromatic prenyltransferase